MGGLQDSSLIVIPFLALTMTGILTGKHFRTLAIVRIITQSVTQEPSLIPIIMFVVEIYFQFLHTRLQQVKVPSLRVRTCCSDKLQLWIFCTQGITELLQSLSKHGAISTMCLVVVPLLVTHTKELQIKGCGVPHISSHLTPLRRDVTIGKLHKVKRILNIGIQIVECHMNTRLGWIAILELAAQSARDNGQRFCTDILCQLEKFEESQSIRLIVIGEVAVVKSVLPAVLVQRTVLDGTNRILPLVACGQVCSLHDTSTGKAEDTGMQILQRLG